MHAFEGHAWTQTLTYMYTCTHYYATYTATAIAWLCHNIFYTGLSNYLMPIAIASCKPVQSLHAIYHTISRVHGCVYVLA